MFIGAATIADVMRDNGIAPEQFFKRRCRKPRVVEARRQAIIRLNGSGFSNGQIARLMQCGYDAVRYVLNPGYRERKNIRNAESEKTRPRKVKGNRPAIPAREREEALATLAEAGLVVGNTDVFKKKVKLTPAQMVELVLLRQRGLRGKARDLAIEWGMQADYPRSLCARLKLPPKYRSGARYIGAMWENGAWV